MASLQNDDCLLVGRKNVDYKVSYQELLGSIEDDLPASDPFPEAPADGNLYVRNGQTKSWVRGLPYDVRTLPELPGTVTP